MANNRHHGPGMGPVQEKAKDFKGSIMRLLKELKPFHILISIALILAMLGLSLIHI